MSKIIVANMKMNISLKEAVYYLTRLNEELNTDKIVVIAPSYIYIPYFNSNKFLIGAQNVSEYDNGAYTGEVSASQLKSVNVRYVITGHSERRKLFNETNLIVNKKIKQCIKNNIIPIVCIGEDKEEKVTMKTKQVIRRELLDLLKDLTKEELDKIVIAYEPTWAIGTGLMPSVNEIDEIIYFIKDIVKSAFKVDLSVIYGGSINKENIDELNKLQYCDGFLIGGASNNVDELLEIIDTI